MDGATSLEMMIVITDPNDPDQGWDLEKYERSKLNPQR